MNNCIFFLNVKLLFIYRLTDSTCWIFQVSCRGLVEPYQRDRSAKVDGYRDSADLDIIHHLGCARGNSFRHDHHGLQGWTLEDLFAAPYAENELYEGELWHTDLLRYITECGEKQCVCWHSCEHYKPANAHKIHTDTYRPMEMQMLAGGLTCAWIYVLA